MWRMWFACVGSVEEATGHVFLRGPEEGWFPSVLIGAEPFDCDAPGDIEARQGQGIRFDQLVSIPLVARSLSTPWDNMAPESDCIVAKLVVRSNDGYLTEVGHRFVDRRVQPDAGTWEDPPEATFSLTLGDAVDTPPTNAEILPPPLLACPEGQITQHLPPAGTYTVFVEEGGVCQGFNAKEHGIEASQDFAGEVCGLPLPDFEGETVSIQGSSMISDHHAWITGNFDALPEWLDLTWSSSEPACGRFDFRGVTAHIDGRPLVGGDSIDLPTPYGPGTFLLKRATVLDDTLDLRFGLSY